MRLFVQVLLAVSFAFILGTRAGAQAQDVDPNIQSRIEQFNPFNEFPTIMPSPTRYECLYADKDWAWAAISINSKAACAEALRGCRKESKWPKTCRKIRGTWF